MTRRQLSRHEREARLRLLIFGALGLALLTIILVPAFGYYREVLTKGSQPIARVDGEAISLESFMRLYGWRQYVLDRQIQQYSQLAASAQGNLLQTQIQQLQARRSELDTTVLNELIEAKLIGKEAAARGITVTREDEDARIAKDFGTPPQPTPTVGPGATPADQPTPLATANPTDTLKSQLDIAKVMTEEDYRSLVVRPTILSERLQDSFMKDVPAADEQVHARRMLLESEDAAKAAKERVDKGEPFDKVASELSKDASTKDRGGDLGWVGHGKLTKPVDDAMFELEPNQVSEPIRSAFGWELIQVVEKDPNRPLTEDQKLEKRNQLFTDWLEKLKDDGFANNTIAYEYSSEKVAWAREQINKARGLPKGTQ